MKHTHPDTAPVVFECDLPDSRHKVWRALTDRELVGKWLMPNDLRPEVGAKFRLSPERVPGAGAPLECEVLEAEPGRKLCWRQREQPDLVAPRLFVESVVTFELSDGPGGGTHLRVIHDGLRSGIAGSAREALQPKACAAVIPFVARGPWFGRRKSGPFCSIAALRRAA